MSNEFHETEQYLFTKTVTALAISAIKMKMIFMRSIGSLTKYSSEIGTSLNFEITDVFTFGTLVAVLGGASAGTGIGTSSDEADGMQKVISM